MATAGRQAYRRKVREGRVSPDLVSARIRGASGALSKDSWV